MNYSWQKTAALLLTLLLLLWLLLRDDPPGPMASEPARPALTVSVVSPQWQSWPLQLVASGNIMAWQEASIGAEANALRLHEVYVNVGDQVRKGQLLAQFAADTVQAELALSRAAVSEAQARLKDAAADAARARSLVHGSVALSKQQVQRYLNAEQIAAAQLNAAQAALQLQQLRLKQCRVLAPDDGVISARTATKGAVVPAGQELFRLIRKNRLEWRAEVAAGELDLLRAGQQVKLLPVGGAPVQGRLRSVAPVVDTQNRNGLIYVDLPAGSAVSAGMFARGEFVLGDKPALVLPAQSVVQRDGFSYVFVLQPDSTVRLNKVSTGRRQGEAVEILAGLALTARVVALGGAFLSDGDQVQLADPALVRQLSAEGI
ncbi:efflux RND transporter periplasmic adaptor subunit [Rheinheimera sp.]|uniref:efflux RND transporter periplasmic adaptor subunit n=1 Tax=Rheinheimera sp. TaxID=1869214 RepID=UPI00307F3E02